PPESKDSDLPAHYGRRDPLPRQRDGGRERNGYWDVHQNVVVGAAIWSIAACATAPRIVTAQTSMIQTRTRSPKALLAPFTNLPAKIMSAPSAAWESGASGGA